MWRTPALNWDAHLMQCLQYIRTMQTWIHILRFRLVGGVCHALVGLLDKPCLYKGWSMWCNNYILYKFNESYILQHVKQLNKDKSLLVKTTQLSLSHQIWTFVILLVHRLQAGLQKVDVPDIGIEYYIIWGKMNETIKCWYTSILILLHGVILGFNTRR